MKTSSILKNAPLKLLFAVIIIIFAGATARAADEAEPTPNIVKNVPSQAEQQRLAAEMSIGVGPVVTGSVNFDALPSKARKFLSKHCDGHAVVKCEKTFSSGEYNIQLADGIIFEFDTKGNIMEAEAPEGYSLSSPLLKAVVPGKLYHLLIHNGFYESVEAVHRDREGYRITVADPVFKAVTFDPSGVLTLVVND